MTTQNTKMDALRLSVDLVSAYIQGNPVNREEILPFVQQVFSGINSLCEGSTLLVRQGNLRPAVPVEESVKDDYIVCLEDGKKLQMLKRHLWSMYKMTLDQYKERWGLPLDYPVVSPNYAKRRSEIAKTSGLGQTGRRGRKKMAAAAVAA